MTNLSQVSLLIVVLLQSALGKREIATNKVQVEENQSLAHEKALHMKKLVHEKAFEPAPSRVNQSLAHEKAFVANLSFHSSTKNTLGIEHSNFNSSGAAPLLTSGSTKQGFMQAATSILTRARSGVFHKIGLRAFSKPDGLMDYEKILKTHVENPKVGWVIAALLLWAFFLTWMLVTTAEHFFVPPLMYWTRKLKLQPEIAGATLLAFGNGAPDVFSAGAAVRAQDIPLLLGEMLGTNAFLLCVVMGSLILASQGKQTAVPAKSKFLYTIVCYILAVLANFIIISDGSITIAESIFLLSFYACYVFSLVFWNACQPEIQLHERPSRERISAWSTSTVPPPIPPLQGLMPPISGCILDYLLFGAALPFYVIRWVTIPPSDDCWDSTRRTLSALSPLGAVGLCYMVFGSEADKITWAMVSAGACFVGAAAYCATDDGPDTPCLYPAFTLLAKVSSCIWLAFLAAELTTVVKALGVVLGIPSALLGITVVAWGNSFGDLLSGLSVTRSGDGRLAVIAVFSAPLFSNLVGFGISSWMAAKEAGGRAVIFQEQDVRTRITLLMPLMAALLCVLLSASIIWIAYHSVGYSSVPKVYWAFGLFACYGMFMGWEILDVISPTTPKWQ